MYTDEQYAVMKLLAPGIRWSWHKDETKDDILRFIDHEGLAQPRAYIHADHWELSQKGQAVLAAHERQLTQAKERNNEMAEQKAADISAKKQERTFQVRLVLLGFVLGVISEHFIDILGFIARLFQKQ